jgi:hypothetical protein
MIGWAAPRSCRQPSTLALAGWRPWSAVVHGKWPACVACTHARPLKPLRVAAVAVAARPGIWQGPALCSGSLAPGTSAGCTTQQQEGAVAAGLAQSQQGRAGRGRGLSGGWAGGLLLLQHPRTWGAWWQARSALPAQQRALAASGDAVCMAGADVVGRQHKSHEQHTGQDLAPRLWCSTLTTALSWLSTLNASARTAPFVQPALCYDDWRRATGPSNSPRPPFWRTYIHEAQARGTRSRLPAVFPSLPSTVPLLLVGGPACSRELAASGCSGAAGLLRPCCRRHALRAVANQSHLLHAWVQRQGGWRGVVAARHGGMAA